VTGTGGLASGHRVLAFASPHSPDSRPESGRAPARTTHSPADPCDATAPVEQRPIPFILEADTRSPLPYSRPNRP
jgi:hypothetical protein